MASEWREVSLSDVCQYLNRGAAPRYVDRDGLLVINQRCIRDQRVEFTDARRTDHVAKPVADERLLRPLDILVNSTGTGTLGRVAQLSELPEPATADSHVTIVRADPEAILPEYLGLLLRCRQNEIEDLAEGSTGQTELSRGRLGSLTIWLPPIAEQRTIARILGSLDRKMELNRLVNATLDSISGALYDSWESSVTSGPGSWKVGVFTDLADVLLGGDWGSDEPTAEESEAVLCVRGADIPDLQRGGTGNMPLRHISASSLEKRRLRAGDLVVEVSGGSPTQSTGRTARVSQRLVDRLEYPIIYSNFCRLLRPAPPAASTYAYLLLRRLYDSGEFFAYENGTTGIKNLAISRFSQTYPIPLPPVPDMTSLASVMDPIFNRQQSQGVETDWLMAVRDQLLPRLVLGEMRVADMAGDHEALR